MTRIRASMPNCKNFNDLIKVIDKQFESSDKAFASTLMSKLTSIKLTGIKGIHEHIMQMRDIVAHLNSLKMEIFDDFLVHFILNFFPSQYNPFKISYNTYKDKWSINELLAMCVQEEVRLIQENGESAYLKRHMRKDCPKRKVWLEKKGNLKPCVCYESNMVYVSRKTLRIDSSSTIHVSNTMQGFLNLRKPTKSECSIYSGN
ncbi:hypothetical protein QQP08_000362 [Theobroma cacao]|nr:hypothetical protein QQP08_000362 [Theobroma cacao]